MRLPHRLQGQKVKSQGGAGAYCGGDLAAQLVGNNMTAVILAVEIAGQVNVSTPSVHVFEEINHY